ncbi:MASE1 domain-containing protein [Streptomyces sp. G-G2]|uniref:MASE1 domain-containing protein n=1 Tax=Streptomyces sp. G-G2 TaxID=3046201 RepID=UPI0024BB20E8|nr:MASE1 domain-containing protein [Streptomyces sp. G-G2]MDJ0379859.1 MASE1 domain-containing protein [Streptomyces sp. G-G2]
MRNAEWRRLPGAVLRILAVAVAYYVTGRIGLLQRVEVDGAIVTPLFLPTGIALSCLLRLGLRVWPGIALGSFLVIETLGSVDPGGLLIVAGNTLAPVCAALLLRRVGFHFALDRLGDGLALVFLGGMVPMLISSTVGALVVMAASGHTFSGFWSFWAAWWAGDAMGVLVVTPLLLLLRRSARLPRDPLWWLEAALLMASVVMVSLLVTRSSLDLLFLVFPLLIWAALRFQLAGAAPCVLLVSVLAISAATDRVGPFAGRTLFEIMVNLQALNGSVALTGLLLSALVTEQQTVRARIEQACLEMAELVDRLVPGGSSGSWRPSDWGDGPQDGAGDDGCGPGSG